MLLYICLHQLSNYLRTGRESVWRWLGKVADFVKGKTDISSILLHLIYASISLICLSPVLVFVQNNIKEPFCNGFKMIRMYCSKFVQMSLCQSVLAVIFFLYTSWCWYLVHTFIWSGTFRLHQCWPHCHFDLEPMTQDATGTRVVFHNHIL